MLEGYKDFELTKRYYNITDSAYRYLDSHGTAYMNLGYWPAPSILEAQNQLVQKLLSFSKLETSSQLKTIIELGPGWGGSRRNFFQCFPDAKYLGINLSADQIRFCKEYNSIFANTDYIQGNFEAVESILEHQTGFKVEPPSLAVGIESVIHLANKEKLFQSLKRLGIQKLLLAEICGDGKELVKKESLFYPSLNFIAPLIAYQEIAERNKFKLKFQDISEKVFFPWSQALESIKPVDFRGSKNVLEKFVRSYRALAKSYQEGDVFYYFIEMEF